MSFEHMGKCALSTIPNMDFVIICTGNDGFTIEFDAPDGGQMSNELADMSTCFNIPHSNCAISGAGDQSVKEGNLF